MPVSHLTLGLAKEDKTLAFKGFKKLEFYIYAVTQSALSHGPLSNDDSSWPGWIDQTVSLARQKGREWVREDEEMKRITMSHHKKNGKSTLIEEI